MPIPPLDPFTGTVGILTPTVRYSPYTAQWWQNSYIDRVPEAAVGWMVAQGWQVTRTYAEDDCGQTFYVMARQSMNSWMILQNLLNEYTAAYNEGRAANAQRYNEIVTFWINGISKVRHSLDDIGDVSDSHVSLYITELDTLVAEVASEVATAKIDMQASADLVTAQLAAYLTKINTLEGLYTSHKTTAEAFLVDLGSTELARINEKYNNLLSTQRQELVNRGLYSSAHITSINTAVERERNEAISALNDRLARERLENEHHLYEQLMSNKGTVLDGQMKYNTAQFQKGQFLTDTRARLCTLLMQARTQKLNGRMDVRDREEKLMAYQLDTHTNLAVGLWGFVERREDEYPSMESVTKLVAGLGDSGGGWVTP